MQIPLYDPDNDKCTNNLTTDHKNIKPIATQKIFEVHCRSDLQNKSKTRVTQPSNWQKQFQYPNR